MAIRSLSAYFAQVNKTIPNDLSHQFGTDQLGPFPKRRERKPSSLLKILIASVLAVSAIGSTGCSVGSGLCRAVKQHDGFDNFMIGYRNRVLAARAWHENKHCIGNRKFKSDFENGFMQGYIDVANGGNGCVPAVAPASYLGWRYQSGNGQAAVNAWFAGYPLGAQAAEQDGVGHWGEVRPNSLNKRQQAVYIPPPVPEPEEDEINPFYRQPYPEPQLEDGDEDDDASASDDPIREALDESMDEDTNPLEAPVDKLELKEGAEEAGDAIRDALEAGLDDSTQFESTPINNGYSATFSDSTPTADSVKRFFDQTSEPDAVVASDDELPFTFE